MAALHSSRTPQSDSVGARRIGADGAARRRWAARMRRVSDAMPPRKRQRYPRRGNVKAVGDARAPAPSAMSTEGHDRDGGPRDDPREALLTWIVPATLETFDREISSPVPVLVEFWAPWCRPSWMMHPLVEDRVRVCRPAEGRNAQRGRCRWCCQPMRRSRDPAVRAVSR
jgi:hypothetical protein